MSPRVCPVGIRSDQGLLHQAAHPAQRQETTKSLFS
jgi:hypothetical protein